MRIRHKESGKLYTILVGTILPKKKRIKKDISGSWLSIKTDGEDPINIIIGYTKDGEFSAANEYEVVDEET